MSVGDKSVATLKEQSLPSKLRSRLAFVWDRENSYTQTHTRLNNLTAPLQSNDHSFDENNFDLVIYFRIQVQESKRRKTTQKVLGHNSVKLRGKCLISSIFFVSKSFDLLLGYFISNLSYSQNRKNRFARFIQRLLYRYDVDLSRHCLELARATVSITF